MVVSLGFCVGVKSGCDETVVPGVVVSDVIGTDGVFGVDVSDTSGIVVVSLGFCVGVLICPESGMFVTSGLGVIVGAAVSVGIGFDELPGVDVTDALGAGDAVSLRAARRTV